MAAEIAGEVQAAGGLDVKQRARWVLGVVFVVATVGLLGGTWRSSQSAEQVQIFVDAEAAAGAGRRLEASFIALQREMWRFEARPGREAARSLRGGFQDAARALVVAEERLVVLTRYPSAAPTVKRWTNEAGDPLLSRASPLESLRRTLGQVRAELKPVLDAPRDTKSADRSAAFRGAHAAVQDLESDAAALSQRATTLVSERAEAAERAVSYVSRDQLVLFLLVLFLMPLAVGVGSAWITAPLIELRRVARRIEAGRVREMKVAGSDEIAQVARAMRSAVKRLEQNDRRQKEKIFEMRRVLRALIQPISDALLVVGRKGKIDYANPAAGQLLGTEVHNLETEVVDEVLFSPALAEALEQAWTGDVVDEGVDVRIETDDGRVAEVHASLRSIRDQQGNISRVVIVMRTGDKESA